MFDDRFELFLADTALSKQTHFQLRYQIYCLEKGFEDTAAHRNFQEVDSYDPSAVHFIVRSRDSGQWLGAMRLALGIPAQLPISRFATIQPDAIDVLMDKRTAEASRLCMLPGRKLQRNDHMNRLVRTHGKDSLDIFHASWISLGLIRAARQYCLNHDIRHCFFLGADSLARILRRVGMEICAIGPLTGHRGLRRPYLHDFHAGYAEMPRKSLLVDEMFGRLPAYRFYSELTDSDVVHPLVANG